MARAKLAIPFESMSGKLDGKSEVYMTNRFGRIVMSNYPKHRDPKTITPHQRELNTKFAQVVQQTKLDMADPARRAYWQQLFDQQKPRQYATLRGFIIAQLNKENN